MAICGITNRECPQTYISGETDQLCAQGVATKPDAVCGVLVDVVEPIVVVPTGLSEIQSGFLGTMLRHVMAGRGDQNA